MKQFFTLFIILGFLHGGYSQSSFSKYFTFPPNIVITSPNIVYSDEHSYISAMALIDGTEFGLFIMKLNAQGDSVWHKIILPLPNSTYYQSPGQNAIVLLGDKLLVSLDYFETTTFEQKGRLLAFDENGSIVWIKDFENENFLSDGALIKIDDQNVARISYSQFNTGNYYWRLDKIDSNGNIIWTKEINADDQSIFNVGSAILSGDTILFASSTKEDISDNLFNHIINMVSLDGFLINQKVISAQPFPSPGNLALNKTRDRLFYDRYSKIGNSSNLYWCLQNWELAGSTSESCIEQNENLRFARGFRRGPDGGVYGIGDIFEEQQTTSQKIGWAFKLMDNGDYQWNKTIVDTLTEYSGGLTDIAFISDSSILACGALYKQFMGTTSSQVWILKFQTNGCFNDYCGDTIYVPSPISPTIVPEKREGVIAWPNPANNYIQISTLDYTTFELRDITGKLFLSGTLDEKNSIINLAGLPTGMFTLITNQNGVIKTKKIIVNRF